MLAQNNSSGLIILSSVLKSSSGSLYSLGSRPNFQKVLLSLICLTCKMGVVIVILPLWAIVKIK